MLGVVELVVENVLRNDTPSLSSAAKLDNVVPSGRQSLSAPRQSIVNSNTFFTFSDPARAAAPDGQVARNVYRSVRLQWGGWGREVYLPAADGERSSPAAPRPVGRPAPVDESTATRSLGRNPDSL
jgi:hypothetical protein